MQLKEIIASACAIKLVKTIMDDLEKAENDTPVVVQYTEDSRRNDSHY